MIRKQSMTRMQLFRLIQKAQNNLIDKSMHVDHSSKMGSRDVKTAKTNDTNQKETSFQVNNAINQYVHAIIQKKKLKKDKELPNKDETKDTSLNPNWNSLSLGTDMYDSLFSFKVDTPQVWYDPLVWNIFYAARPSDYTIPDSKFVNILRTATSQNL